MFTGIVVAACEVVATEQGEEVRSILVNLSGHDEDLEIGASVAIDGVCMTVVSSQNGQVKFEAIPETLDRTTIGFLRQGSRVNIERSLRMGDELGGHLLSGHIMGLGEIKTSTEVGEGLDITIAAPESMMKYIHEKGYIGLNGASLTIGEVQQNEFNIHLIPETLRLTTFATATDGGLVNIEIDAMTQTIVATVERMMKQENGGGHVWASE